MILRTKLRPLSKLIAYCQRDVLHDRTDMHGYQDMAYNFAMSIDRCALFMDLGLGKTVVSGTVALDLMLAGKVRKTLIVGPKRVIRVGWPTDFSEWGHLCFYKISVIDGNAAERKRALSEESMFYSVSVDNLAWLIDHYKNRWPFDMVILDESSMFKSHTSRRFKKLRLVSPRIRRMIQLTATPAAEGYMGLFAQVYLLDNGERFGKTITNYQERYFTQNKYNFKFKLRPGAEEEIIQKISDLCLVMGSEEYLNREKATPISIPVELPSDVADKYHIMEENSLIEVMPEEFDEHLDDPICIEAEQAAALQAKLLQICSGFVYDTKIVGLTADDKVIKQKDAYRLHDAKFDALEEFLDTTAAGKNVLIAYHFKPTLERLKERFKDLVVMDSDGKCIKKWNAGKIRLLAAHPQSAGHGLNLQKGGHILVYVDNPWSLERFLQFNGRLDRQGQQYPVMIYQMEAVIRDASGRKIETADGNVISALRNKEDVQENFLAMLERIKGRIRKRRGRGASKEKMAVWDDEDDD